MQTRTLMWGDEEAHAGLSPPLDVVLAADVAAFVYQDAFELLVSSLRALCCSLQQGGAVALILIGYSLRF